MAYSLSVVASHFHELFGREQAVRDIPNRLNGLDYHIAEGIMVEFSSVRYTPHTEYLWLFLIVAA